MNLIFICIFNNPEYLKLLYLLLESIYLYGELDGQTKILLYTSTPFMKIIKRSNLYHRNIIFETNDNYGNVTLACKARLDLFELATVKRFNKILYLDTDILVKRNIRPIFNIAIHDIIYAIEEGRLDDPRDYYGVSLFQQHELNPHRGRPAFSSGVMLFKNCENIRRLFATIKSDIVRRPRDFACHDQPYIVYHAFRTGLFDNQAIRSMAVNNDLNIYSDKTVHHFPGNTGVYYNKFIEMNGFLRAIKDNVASHFLNECKNYIGSHLLPIIRKSGELLEGNVLMQHETTNYYQPYEAKAKNIITVVHNNPKVRNVLEIGFGSGFSSLLMLLANPNLRITAIDWMKHSYVDPCYQQLKSNFGDRIDLIKGDSQKVLPKLTGSYDLIHIDGSINTEDVDHDIQNSINLCRKTILICDDYNYPHIRELWDKYSSLYQLRDLVTTLYPTDQHNIKWILSKL